MSLLRELSGHPEYVRLLKLAQERRPIIPAWERSQENTDEWKEASAMQKGFDLALQIFQPK